MQAPNPQTPSLLGLCNTSPHTCDKKKKNSLVCDSKTTHEGLEHPHLWWLAKAATSTTPNLEILQGLTPVEDKREFFGYKTLDLQKRHTLLSLKSLIKTCFGFPLYTGSALLETQYV